MGVKYSLSAYWNNQQQQKYNFWYNIIMDVIEAIKVNLLFNFMLHVIIHV